LILKRLIFNYAKFRYPDFNQKYSRHFLRIFAISVRTVKLFDVSRQIKIPVSSVTDIVKMNTAMIIPNAVGIFTATNKVRMLFLFELHLLIALSLYHPLMRSGVVFVASVSLSVRLTVRNVLIS